jgi:hypothetical protein
MLPKSYGKHTLLVCDECGRGFIALGPVGSPVGYGPADKNRVRPERRRERRRRLRNTDK